MSDDKRVVALIDMDCFYVQVEERTNPENKGKPGCVVQYKSWKGGGIIAVNYEARAKGVTRYMRGDEAREKCPDCILYRVPELRGKADLTKYRDAGKEVIDVLWSFGVCIERASIDEAYLDMTSVVNQMLEDTKDRTLSPQELPNTHIVGFNSIDGDERGVSGWLRSLTQNEYNEKNWKLSMAAILCEKMRAAVYEKTGFRCSAGIAGNKMLAKLACGINKPNKQTVLPLEAVGEFFKTYPLKKVRNLGGKLGLTLSEELKCTTMDDIVNLAERSLQQHFDGKTANWLYWYARGVDLEPVSSRRLPKSIGCSKNFTGSAALDTRDKILHWLEELCSEVTERLEKDRETNQRTAKQLTLTVRLEGDIRPSSYTRSVPMAFSYDKTRMVLACFTVMSKENPSKQPNVWNPVITSLGVSASNFVDEKTSSKNKIDRFFTKRNGGSADNKCESPESPQDDPECEEENDDHFLSVVESDQISERKEDDTNNDEPNYEEISTIVMVEDRLPTLKENETERIVNNPIEAPKKTGGFFANRVVKKNLIPNVEPISESEGFVIEEIFPNLDEVDMDTLGLLPLAFQRKIRKAMDARGGACYVNADSLTTCEKCSKELFKEEIEEHKDYHLALELQKEVSPMPSTSSSASMSTMKKESSAKSVKRPLKDQKKKTEKNSKRTRTIETFFRNPA